MKGDDWVRRMERMLLDITWDAPVYPTWLYVNGERKEIKNREEFLEAIKEQHGQRET